MTWLADHWLDVLGWGGSALLVYSLLQASVLRLRVLNAIACVILIVFNGVLEVWPMVGMNIVLVAINAWFIVTMLRERHDESAFEVLEVAPDDAYLLHTLRVHREDISRSTPGSSTTRRRPTTPSWCSAATRRSAWCSCARRATRPTCCSTTSPPATATSPPVSSSGAAAACSPSRGIRRVVTPPGMVGAYYDRLGFRRVGRVVAAGSRRMITTLVRRVVPLVGLAGCRGAARAIPARSDGRQRRLVAPPAGPGVPATAGRCPAPATWASSTPPPGIPRSGPPRSRCPGWTAASASAACLARRHVHHPPARRPLPVCRRHAAPLPAALATFLGVAAAAPGLSARPQVVSYLLIALVTAAWLETARDGRPAGGSWR